MPEDPEIQAMSAVVDALEDLEQPVRERVIEWAARRYGLAATAKPLTGNGRVEEDEEPDVPDDNEDGGKPSSNFVDFADLYDALEPTTDMDRALVGGYWFQVVEGAASFTGLQVNNALKDLGHGLDNVARALGNLQAKSPALVRQIAKSGRSKQARKTYKLTAAGINAIANQL